MVLITRGSGFSSGSSAQGEAIDERIHEFIMSEFTQGVLDATLVNFGTIKKGIRVVG